MPSTSDAPQTTSKPKAVPLTSDKTFKVSEVYFSRMTRLPGYPGACTLVRTGGEAPGLGTNQHQVKSLVIVEGVHNKLIIDGKYFMSFASGAIDGWVY